MQMGREGTRGREGEEMRMDKAQGEVGRGGEPQRKQKAHQPGRRESRPARVIEPRLDKEGGVHRTGATERSVRGQKCPLDCQDRCSPWL